MRKTRKTAKRLALTAETIRALTNIQLEGIGGGAAATDGATNCPSEHTSCIAVSCTCDSHGIHCIPWPDPT